MRTGGNGKNMVGEGRWLRHINLHSESSAADKSVCFMNGSMQLRAGRGHPV